MKASPVCGVVTRVCAIPPFLTARSKTVRGLEVTYGAAAAASSELNLTDGVGKEERRWGVSSCDSQPSSFIAAQIAIHRPDKAHKHSFAKVSQEQKLRPAGVWPRQTREDTHLIEQRHRSCPRTTPGHLSPPHPGRAASSQHQQTKANLTPLFNK